MSVAALGGLTPDDDDRRVRVALHVLRLLRPKAMTAGDQVMVLMMAAGSLIAGATATQAEREDALAFACGALGSGVAGAVRATEKWLAELPPAGQA